VTDAAPPSPDATGASPQGVTRAALGMGAVTAGSRVIGFGRVLIVAAVLGTTYLGNTFQASNSVSNVLFELVAAGALSAALVPGFVTAIARDGHAEVERSANALLGMALVVLGTFSVIAMGSARWIADLLVSRAPTAAIAHQQSDLATFLLWFFIPQIVLYAFGAIAIAVLQARRQFLVGSYAPVASSIVMIGALLVFRVLAGPDPGLELSLAEKLVLAFAGTAAVVAFVAVPGVALWKQGIRLVPTLRWRGSGAGGALRTSMWAVVLHGALGLLLGTALIAGNAVEGGVVAYQVAWTFFLAPYAILAQPIHTAILPELTVEADDPATFAASVRWGLAGMARLLIPVSIAMFGLATPMMKVVAFGAADSGARLFGAALAWLAIGLFPYGALLLATRAYFALGDTRTPGVITLAGVLLGGAIMLIGAQTFRGTAVVVMLGIGQSAAATLSAVTLLAVLRARLGYPVTPRIILPVLAVSLPLGVLLVWSTWQWSFDTRIMNVLVFGAIGALAAAVYVVIMRSWSALRVPARSAP